MTVVSYITKSYATSIRLLVAENLEKRTKQYLMMMLLSDNITSEYYYLETPVKNKRSLAQHIWSKRLNPASNWPCSVLRTEATENVVERLEGNFAMCRVPLLDKEAYAKPHLYLP